MQRIGGQAARLLKTLAGIDKDEPMSSYLIALYSFLFLIAAMLVFIWATGTRL